MGIQKTSEEATWTCEIGPIEREKIPGGGDLPFRLAVKDVFVNMFGQEAPVCSSGWGRIEDEEIRRLAQFIMEEVPGEPSQSEGAVDTAIRLIRESLNKQGD